MFCQHAADDIDYFFGVLEDIDIPEADHAAAMRFEPARACCITAHLRFVRVGFAIQFYNELRLRTEEIGNVRTDACLPAEAEARELFASKQTP